MNLRLISTHQKFPEQCDSEDNSAGLRLGPYWTSRDELLDVIPKTQLALGHGIIGYISHDRHIGTLIDDIRMLRERFWHQGIILPFTQIRDDSKLGVNGFEIKGFYYDVRGCEKIPARDVDHIFQHARTILRLLERTGIRINEAYDHFVA